MRGIADSEWRTFVVVIVIGASCMTLGCSPNPAPPDLTAITASGLISQSWSHDELSHFGVYFHSDDLIECGVKADLWKLAEVNERGFTWTTYRLTPKGSKIFFAIDLKGSGKGHEITFRGPYRLEITNIAPGSDPDTRRVDFRWEIDWDKAPPDLKTCLPKFELSGYEVATFKLSGLNWKFVSYAKPDDASTPPGTTPVAVQLP